MSTKGIAKTFVDDTTAEVFDLVYKLAKVEYGNKKEAEKLVKYVVKIIVKVGILLRNDQFNAAEIKMVEQFQTKFHNLVMTVISFHEVEFTFDADYLVAQVKMLEDLLSNTVKRHLSDKSLKRITYIFAFFQRVNFLDKLFDTSDNGYKSDMNKIIKCLNKLIEEGNI
eukprot:gene9809-10815_t